MKENRMNGLRGWMHFIALAGAASLLMLTVLACVGCGRTEQGAVEEQQVAGENEGSGTTIITTTEVEEDEEDAEDEDVSISGGNMDFSLEEQEIGSGDFNPDLKVTDIRWADHGEYFRIVFEFEMTDGSEVSEVPNCNTWYPGAPGDKKYYELYISLNDIPFYTLDYAPFAAADTPISLGDPLVETIERVSGADTEPVFFLVRSAHSDAHPGVSSRPHRLMYESDPMRVILDIQKM